MQYTKLGHTGVEVSRLAFGTMSFGGDADEAGAAALYKRTREAGINFYDTAVVYQQGRSEQILGKLIEGERDHLVISSKVFGSATPGIGRGLSRRHILWEAEQSLRRLRTDRIDIYFLHNYDADVPAEEILAALDTLVQQGKIIYPAASNWAAWQIADALGISDRRNLAPFAVLQPIYSLVKRQVEVEILPLAAAKNLGVIPYSPLGGGLLSGKYGVDRKPATGRLVDQERSAKRYGDPNFYAIADKFTAYAKEHGVHPATLAVAWVGSHPAVTAPIIGARNVEQLEDLLPAGDVRLTAEQRAEVGRLSYQPPLATDRLEQQSGDSAASQSRAR